MTTTLLLLLSLLALSSAQQQPSNQGCSFQSSRTPYTLSWIFDSSSQSIFFNLTYRNFPQGSYTGVGFGQNMASGLDVILVSLPSGSSIPQVIDASVRGYTQPTRDSNSEVQTRSVSYNGGTLNAQFIRPLQSTNGGTSLNGCVTWNFISSPGSAYSNGTYSKHSSAPEQQQQCNLSTRCAGTIPAQFINTPNTFNQNQQYQQQSNQMSQQYGQMTNQMANQQQQMYNQQMYQQQPLYSNQQYSNQYSNQQYNQNQQYGVGSGAQMQQQQYYSPYNNQQNQQYGRRKRQANANIYGYNSDSNAASSGLTLVQNPNYQFIPNYLADQYGRTYQQIAAQYDATNGGSTNGVQRNPSGNTVATQPPVLSNQQQNQQNFQNIQRDSASGAYSTVAPATNIYGYTYQTPGNSAAGTNGRQFDSTGNTQTSGNNGLFYASANRGPQPGQIVYYDTSALGRKKRSISSSSSSSSFPSSSSSSSPSSRSRRQVRFYDPGNNQSAMYYPYRTETDFNLNAGQRGFSQVGGTTNGQQFNNGVNQQTAGTQRFYDTSRGVYVDSVPQFDSRGGNQYLKTAPVNPQSPNFVQTLQNNARALNDYVDSSCTKQDPYWCQSYVAQIVQAQGSYSGGLCNTLVASLQYSDNRCCNAVRTAGCQS